MCKYLYNLYEKDNAVIVRVFRGSLVTGANI